MPDRPDPRPGARATLDTPFGPFTVVVDADGVVLAAGWTTTPDDEVVPLIHPTLRPAELVERPELGAVTAAVTAFHDGEPGPAATLPVRQYGGGFLQQVWARMREIPAGTSLSYSELATRAGRPLAPRGAAQACAHNAIGLFVPDHRVKRGDGSLGGFRWGLSVKEGLLAAEAAQAAERSAAAGGDEEGEPGDVPGDVPDAAVAADD
ncbi:methylated-DNA--[protein]-cysteine S-methyltransferase [Actinomycetospora sp. TBRC 11914]|uniref:methylated-DNA--[protein]-cysteine S-methyltransferase n=1 Tax=Actinomycetospora sp. TBRC 11914 TaxID=2729387 RepID=UPI00145D64CF|nr:methylated-DNA--[protein]-cysteine S-methyltransferase [Actinomycetospora sp. TBRC 11914]NMO88860.1 methylated-DNA--[protein]-cysteine S-methyltransferase [Actinomycetospora sp. TBRC 11914]